MNFPPLCYGSSTSTGTGNLELSGVGKRAFQTLIAGIGADTLFPYAIQCVNSDEWEEGLGKIVSGSPNELQRVKVIASSNANAAVDFGGGEKRIGLVFPSVGCNAAWSFKFPVRVVATTNVTLSSALENGDTLDGVTLATGDRVLLTAQSTASQNGIYVVAASGSPSRAADLYAGDSARGAVVVAMEGTAGAGKSYVCTSAAGSDVVGTNSLTWALSGGATSFPLVDTTEVVKDPSDSTKRARIDVGAVGTGTTRVITMGNRDVDLASGGTFAELVHATRHQHGGADEIATATAGANAIPKAGSGGTLAAGWLPTLIGDSGGGGTKGAVPAPAAGDAAAGKFLKADGTWTAPTGSGDVVGPGSATDNAIVRFDSTTGKLIQNSGVTIDDNDKISAKASFCPLYSNSDGATITFDLNQSNQHKVTLGGNRTLALSNVATGQNFNLRLAQDATGGRTVTWWSGITWMTNSGAAPTLKTAADAVDCFVFRCTGTGTYDGWHVSGQVRELQVAAVQTASFTAVAGNLYPVNLSGAGADFTMTLPASPADGDTIATLITATHATYKLLVGRNGKTLQKGTNANPYRTWQVGERITWRYVDGGWLIVEDGRIPFAGIIRRSTARTLTAAAWTAVQPATSGLDRGGVVDTTNYRINIPRDCLAEVAACVVLDSTANTTQHTVLVNVSKNTADESGVVLRSLQNPASPSSSTFNLPSARIDPEIISLVAGDYLSLQAYQTNASTANRDTFSSNSVYYPSLRVTEVLIP